MSRKATAEYLGQQRRRYCTLKSKEAKTLLLDEFCQITGYERKHANKLLRGVLKFREHPGRGRTYSDKALELIEKMWHCLGCICPQYMAARMKKHLSEFKEVCHVPEKEAEMILKISASTIARHLKGKVREKPGSLRKAYARASKNPQLAFVKVGSGELELASTVTPGDIQVDTVALCGGDMSGNFIWILVLVDRRTQWIEFRPVWNRGANGIFNALERMIDSFPFQIISLHYDNGCEFMNAHLARFAQDHPQIKHGRSRTGKCNDNAHVEEKNGNIVRGVFGEIRYDDPNILEELWDFCEKWSGYINLCNCSVQLVKRVKRTKAKGYKKFYDTPMTPAERAIPHLEKRYAERLTRQANKTNGIILREKLLMKLKRIKRKMKDDLHEQEKQVELDASRRPFGDVQPASLAHSTTTNSVKHLTQHQKPHSSKHLVRCHPI